ARGHAQLDALAELLRRLDRHELRPAHEAALLSTARRVDETLEGARVRLIPGARRVEDDEQQRDVSRLGSEDRLDADVEQEPAVRGRRVLLLPGLERHAVERGSVG